MRIPCRTHHQNLVWVCGTEVAGPPHPLGPWLELSSLSEAGWLEAIISFLQGRGKEAIMAGQHSLSITVIAGGFYELVMWPESGQPSVLLSQFGDFTHRGRGWC